MENSSSETVNGKPPSPSLFNIQNILISIVGIYLHYEEILILKSDLEVNFSSILFTISTIIASLAYLASIQTPDWIDKKNALIKFVYVFVITLVISNILQTLIWVNFNKALYFVCHYFAQSMELSLFGTALPRVRPISDWIKNVPYHVIRNSVALFIFFKTMRMVGAFDFFIPCEFRRQTDLEDEPDEMHQAQQAQQAQPEVTLIFLPDNVTKYFAPRRTRTRLRSPSRIYDLRPRSKRRQSRDRKAAKR